MTYAFDNENHVHTLDGKALTGTSSIGDVLAKPLTWWASGLAVGKLGWIHPEVKQNGRVVSKVPLETRLKASGDVQSIIKGMTPLEYLDLLDEAYKAHSVKLKDTAQDGTDLHAELERFVKWKMGLSKKLLEQFDPKINPFIEWADENVKRFLWSEAHCFDEILFVGGISDCGVELNDGTYAVIDFKSSKDAYPVQFIQCAGYAIQIEKNGLWSEKGTANKKFEHKIESLIIVPFGAKEVKPVIRKDVDNCKSAFISCVDLYRFLGLSKN